MKRSQTLHRAASPGRRYSRWGEVRGSRALGPSARSTLALTTRAREDDLGDVNNSVTSASVVVGVDGTPSSEAALRWAVQYADNHHRPITLVHAVGHTPGTGSEAYRVQARQTKRIAARRIVDHAFGQVQQLSPGLDVHVWVPFGGAHDVLMQAATRASVVVVGTRGRGSIATLLLGSVSVGLSAHAPCPVVVARGAKDGRDQAGRHGVVVGVDGTVASTTAIEFAFELAASLGQPLQVAHAVSALGQEVHSSDLRSFYQKMDIRDERELQVAESVDGYQEKFPDIAVSWQFIEADAAADLVRLSEDASVVVVGSRGRADAAAILLGSVSRSVVKHAHCTVAVVRPPLDQLGRHVPRARRRGET